MIGYRLQCIEELQILKDCPELDDICRKMKDFESSKQNFNTLIDYIMENQPEDRYINGLDMYTEVLVVLMAVSLEMTDILINPDNFYNFCTEYFHEHISYYEERTSSDDKFDAEKAYIQECSKIMIETLKNG